MIPVDVLTAVAGGHCLGKFNGRVVFIRGALPGELVQAEVTGHGKGGAFLWADAREILNPSPGRVTPPCPVAGICGGCDWQHASLDEQRRIKALVIADALKRTGGIERDVTVEALDDGDGLGWRTRMRYAVGTDGAAGLRALSSHDVIAVDGCPLAVSEIREPVRAHSGWPRSSEVVAAASNTGQLSITDISELPELTEEVAHRHFKVSPDGFWQVHPKAAATLVETVMAFAEVSTGDRVLDLYSGVGLFSAFLAEAAGPTGDVIAVEGDRRAVELAKLNLADLPQAKPIKADVAKWLRRDVDSPCDVVVLDPPRSGAGAQIVKEIASRQPRRIVYVACDPVALARDLKTFHTLGRELLQLRCLDMFPMTKHVECVALIG